MTPGGRGAHARAVTARHDDLYRILQVDPAASPLVIQAAYRVLAQIFHPDVNGDPEDMKRINAAWDVLRDPDRRRRYDAERAMRLATAGMAGAGAGGAAGSPPAPRHASTASPRPSPAASVRGAGASSAAHAAAPAPAPAHRPVADDHAGPPQGPAYGSVLRFGRYEGWSLGQVARVDRPFLEWLRRVPAGRTLKDEIDAVLRESEASPTYAHRRREALSTKHVHSWAPGARTSLR